MGFAGQVGHVPHSNNGITCELWPQGLLGDRDRVRCGVAEIGGAGAGSIRTKRPTRTIRWKIRFGKSAGSEEAAVRQVLIEVGQQLAFGAAQLVHALNPATLVVGGRLGQLLKLVEAEIRESLNAVALPGMLDDFVFQISDTGVDPLHGCLAIVHDAVLSDPFNLTVELSKPTGHREYAI